MINVKKLSEALKKALLVNSDVELICDGSKIVIIGNASSGEITVITKIDCDNSKFKTSVDGYKLLQAISPLQDDINILPENGGIKIESCSMKLSLTKKEVVRAREVEISESFTTSNKFLKYLKESSHVMNDNFFFDSCQYLRGNRVIAIDSGRVSIRGNTDGIDAKVLIPKRCSKIIQSVFEDKEIKISTSKERIIFFDEKTTVSSSQLSKRYIDEEMLFKKFRKKIEYVVNKNDILGFLNTSFMSETKLIFKRSEMLITAPDTEFYNEFQVVIPGEYECSSDEILGAKYNTKYLKEALVSIDSESISIIFESKMAPLLITDKTESFEWIMPKK